MMPLFFASLPPPWPFQVMIPFHQRMASPKLAPRFVPRMSRLAPAGPAPCDCATLLVMLPVNLTRVALPFAVLRVITDEPRLNVPLLKYSAVSLGEAEPVMVRLPPRKVTL